MALCLKNSDLVAATVTQAQVEACVASSTSARVVRCLRLNFRVPPVLMQGHIPERQSSAGQAGIAVFLDNNGLLPVPLVQAKVVPDNSTNSVVNTPRPPAGLIARWIDRGANDNREPETARTRTGKIRTRPRSVKFHTG